MQKSIFDGMASIHEAKCQSFAQDLRAARNDVRNKFLENLLGSMEEQNPMWLLSIDNLIQLLVKSK